MVRRDEAFALFFRQEYPPLRQLAYRLTCDWSAAEDLAQDAMARAYAAWSRIRRQARPGLYVRAILVNRHRSQLRRLRVGARHAPILAQEAIARDSANDWRAAVWAELSSLPVRQRQALVLHFYEDLPHAEIGVVLGCPKGTIDSLVARGLARLRSRLAEDADAWRST